MVHIHSYDTELLIITTPWRKLIENKLHVNQNLSHYNQRRKSTRNLESWWVICHCVLIVTPPCDFVIGGLSKLQKISDGANVTRYFYGITSRCRWTGGLPILPNCAGKQTISVYEYYKIRFVALVGGNNCPLVGPKHVTCSPYWLALHFLPSPDFINLKDGTEMNVYCFLCLVIMQKDAMK